MELQIIDAKFSVCKLESLDGVDMTDEFCFIAKTDEEVSLVCTTGHVPPRFAIRDDGWRAFRIKGVLDFSLIGILSKITAILAENKIGIFAVSTFNTDYILTKEADFTKAVEVLAAGGYALA